MLRDSPLHNTQIERTYRESMTGHYYRGSRWSKFSHLIHSHPLFIPLGETAGFSSQRRDPGTPSILMSKRETPCGIVEWITKEWKQKKKVRGESVSATRTAMNQQAHCKSNHYKSVKKGKKLQMWKPQNPKCGNINYWASPPPPTPHKQVHTDGLAT